MNKYEKAFEKVKDACVGFDTVDELIELKKLVERATPKKMKKLTLYAEYTDPETFGICPICENELYDDELYDDVVFCHYCGQALRWGYRND